MTRWHSAQPSHAPQHFVRDKGGRDKAVAIDDDNAALREHNGAMRPVAAPCCIRDTANLTQREVRNMIRGERSNMPERHL